MKKIVLTFTVVLIALFCSCKATPELNVVNSKDFNDLITQQKIQQQEAQHEEIVQPVFPDKWEVIYEDFNGRFRMVIDADVITSNAKEYPIASIKPYYIPIDQANNIIENIFGTRRVFFTQQYLTKEQLAKRIIDFKAERALAENNGEYEKVKEFDETTDFVLGIIDDAPEEYAQQAYLGDYIYEENDDGSESHYVNLRLDPTDFNSPALLIYNQFNMPYSNGYDSNVSYSLPSLEYEYYTDQQLRENKYDEHPIFNTNDAKSAIQIADDFLASCNIRNKYIMNMQAIVKHNTDHEAIGYMIEYGKEFNCIHIPPNIQQGGSGISNDQEMYRPSYFFESLTIGVMDNQINFFEWNNIFEIDSILIDNVKLMPFERIMDSAAKQLTVKYAYLKEDTYEDFALTPYIDKIVLTYAVEPIKNEQNGFALIPVWAFYGGLDYGEEGMELLDGTIRKGKYKELGSFLTVNAIDGSVIYGR